MTKYNGIATCEDSREDSAYKAIPNDRNIKWVITSPPYYGMRTYIPDQWLRLWFLGGKPKVDYSNEDQLPHQSPDTFSSELKKVWYKIAKISENGARLVIRFGGINYRKADPKEIIKDSLSKSGWKIMTILGAGSASRGKRQAEHFSKSITSAQEEFDVWAYKQI